MGKRHFALSYFCSVKGMLAGITADGTKIPSDEKKIPSDEPKILSDVLPPPPRGNDASNRIHILSNFKKNEKIMLELNLSQNTNSTLQVKGQAAHQEQDGCRCY